MFDYIAQRLARHKVTIMVFHKVPMQVDPMAPYEADLATFERVLDFICRRYRLISMREAVQGLRDGKLPSGSVCLTFDDGYDDWTQAVVPLLESRQVPATFYVTTGQFNGVPLWHERIRHAVSLARGAILSLDGRMPDLPTATPADRQASVLAIEGALKYLTLAQRETLLTVLEAQTGSMPAALPRMTPDQVREIHARGFEIGAHSVDHPILSMCSDEAAAQELLQSRLTLEEIIGAPVTGLAYPNGRNRDFTTIHARLAREAGYDYALTTEPGSMGKDTPLFQIPRFTPWGPGPLRMLVQMSRNLMLPVNYQPETGS